MAKKGFHKSWYLANVGCAACIIAYNYFAFGQINGTSTVAIAMIAYPIIFAIWKFFYVGFQYLPDVLLNYIPDVDELITLRRREGIYSSASRSPRLSPSTHGLLSLLPPASFRPPATATP